MTPETDEEEFFNDNFDDGLCWSKFARKLEEERDSAREESARLKKERDGALHSSETWELLHAKVQKELEELKAAPVPVPPS